VLQAASIPWKLDVETQAPLRTPWLERFYEQYGKEVIIGLLLALASALWFGD
jgi:hypothetical protein